MSNWQLWLIAGLGLLISEMFAPGFWLVNVAVGCFAGALVGLVPGLGLAVQTAAFAAGTLVSAILFRPILLRHFHRGGTVRTNVEALIGKTGIVTQRIEGAGRLGRVVVEGEDWRGAAIDDAAIEPGTRITVIEVDGTTLKVDREFSP